MATIDKAFIVTTPEIPGYKVVKSLGMVYAKTDDYNGGKEWDKLISSAASQLIAEAEKIGANAIIGAHYQVFTKEDAGSILRAFSFGTAVVVEPLPAN